LNTKQPSNLRARKRLARFLTGPLTPTQKALKNIAQVTSFTYKNFFTIPQVKVVWKQGNSNRYGRLKFSINKKKVRGSIQFDSPFFFDTYSKTQAWLDSWLSQKLTPVINSIEDKASLDKKKARAIIENLYKVKVK
jgi:hypothetical protein